MTPIEVLEGLRDSIPKTHHDWPGVVRAIEVLRADTEHLGLIGRDDFIVRSFTEHLAGDANKHHEVTKVWGIHRGYAFDANYLNRTSHAPTGHTIRVTATLQPAIEQE